MKLEVVTLGALLHDIGKFYQRGVKNKEHQSSESKRHEDYSEEFIKENKELISFLLGREVSEEELEFLQNVAQCHIFTFIKVERRKRKKGVLNF